MSRREFEGRKMMGTSNEGFEPMTIGPEEVVESTLFVWLPKGGLSAIRTQ
jgi:hypothetical protein